MGIHSKPRDAKGNAEHDVRGFSPDAGEGHQLLDATGNFASETLHECRRAGDYRFCFDVEEPGWLDDCFDPSRVGVGERGCVRIGAEKPGGYRVHGAVRGLGRQDRRYQHLERVLMAQLGGGRVDAAQPRNR